MPDNKANRSTVLSPYSTVMRTETVVLRILRFLKTKEGLHWLKSAKFLYKNFHALLFPLWHQQDKLDVMPYQNRSVALHPDSKPNQSALVNDSKKFLPDTIKSKYFQLIDGDLSEFEWSTQTLNVPQGRIGASFSNIIPFASYEFSIVIHTTARYYLTRKYEQKPGGRQLSGQYFKKCPTNWFESESFNLTGWAIFSAGSQKLLDALYSLVKTKDTGCRYTFKTYPPHGNDLMTTVPAWFYPCMYHQHEDFDQAIGQSLLEKKTALLKRSMLSDAYRAATEVENYKAIHILQKHGFNLSTGLRENNYWPPHSAMKYMQYNSFFLPITNAIILRDYRLCHCLLLLGANPNEMQKVTAYMSPHRAILMHPVDFAIAQYQRRGDPRFLILLCVYGVNIDKVKLRYDARRELGDFTLNAIAASNTDSCTSLLALLLDFGYFIQKHERIISSKDLKTYRHKHRDVLNAHRRTLHYRLGALLQSAYAISKSFLRRTLSFYDRKAIFYAVIQLRLVVLRQRHPETLNPHMALIKRYPPLRKLYNEAKATYQNIFHDQSHKKMTDHFLPQKITKFQAQRVVQARLWKQHMEKHSTEITSSSPRVTISKVISRRHFMATTTSEKNATPSNKNKCDKTTSNSNLKRTVFLNKLDSIKEEVPQDEKVAENAVEKKINAKAKSSISCHETFLKYTQNYESENKIEKENKHTSDLKEVSFQPLKQLYRNLQKAFQLKAKIDELSDEFLRCLNDTLMITSEPNEMEMCISSLWLLNMCVPKMRYSFMENISISTICKVLICCIQKKEFETEEFNPAVKYFLLHPMVIEQLEKEDEILQIMFDTIVEEPSSDISKIFFASFRRCNNFFYLPESFDLKPANNYHPKLLCCIGEALLLNTIKHKFLKGMTDTAFMQSLGQYVLDGILNGECSLSDEMLNSIFISIVRSSSLAKFMQKSSLDEITLTTKNALYLSNIDDGEMVLHIGLLNTGGLAGVSSGTPDFMFIIASAMMLLYTRTKTKDPSLTLSSDQIAKLRMNFDAASDKKGLLYYKELVMKLDKLSIILHRKDKSTSYRIRIAP